MAVPATAAESLSSSLASYSRLLQGEERAGGGERDRETNVHFYQCRTLISIQFTLIHKTLFSNSYTEKKNYSILINICLNSISKYLLNINIYLVQKPYKLKYHFFFGVNIYLLSVKI